MAAGTLVIDNIEDGLGNVGKTKDMIFGSAKAWVNFNGIGTVAIRNSYNVSSITDIAVGKFEANFTVPMPNINYCLLGTCGRGVDTGASRSVQLSDTPTVSKCQFQTMYSTVDIDEEYNFIAILST